MVTARLGAAGPRVRLRLRTVLIVVSLVVLVLPAASLQVLRIYEGVLLRQTEASLAAQGAWAAAAYAAVLAPLLGGEAGRYGRELQPAPHGAPRDLAESAPLPLPPEPRPGGTPAPWSRAAAAQFGDVLRTAKAGTGANIRVLDANGTVVASTQDEAGLSLAHWEEVAAALSGSAASRLRRTQEKPPIAAISRNTALRVLVARPVLVGGRVAGAVLLSRSPGTILATLAGKQALLLQAAGLVVAVVVGIALIAARTLVLPIQRLGRAARRLSRGETDTFEGGRPYRVIELAELAESVEAMAHTLQQRAGYVRDFARHVNHEFKTPIAAMRGAIELLSEHAHDMAVPERERFIANLAADVERLERLTMRLLELAYADMTDVTDETADVVAVAHRLQSPVLRVSGEEGRCKARIAASSLQAVLEHLVANAVECGASTVAAAARREADAVVLDVADDGPGISPGNRGRVFEAFFTTRRDSGGTGLGLAISQSLVRHAGGTLALRPTQRGATFRITLPAA